MAQQKDIQIDDEHHHKRIEVVCKKIFQGGEHINETVVESVLKPLSEVPTRVSLF